ncbi:MAG: alanine--tRNA ligase [Candidatus Omnitrophota bacterium]
MRHTELRKKFLDFFKSKSHTICPSDLLVPAGDNTLLFTSAGMNQFKEQFMGNIKGFRRAASCQKCLRTPDLENVGKTAYHHTFFEMLGNFSFGDYFKEDAIKWGWEFMTKELDIKEDKLWASVYEEDDEAYNIWKEKVGIPSERIVKLGPKSNFWPSEAKEKGPNGPCGPCSEIFYDYGEGVGCGKMDCTPACDCGRFVEVWNLVFTQFERKDGGVLGPLPNKNIDTGMGLERLCAVMQGVLNNFDTDLFAPIMRAIKEEVPERLQASNIKAVADHVRAVAFAICDGVAPSNEERGYVIRNLIRRAALHVKSVGVEKPFLYKLVYTVAKVMEEPYPELMKRHQDIAQVIKFEEERFASTLKDSMPLLEDAICEAEASGNAEISGDIAFSLTDTHGLPLVIIKDVAEKRGCSINEVRYNVLMKEQRERSRKTSKISAAVFVENKITDKTEFIGYDIYKSQAKILRILTPDGRESDKATGAKKRIDIILDRSVFYGESGGQAGDIGILINEGLMAKVVGAKKLQDAIILEVEIRNGEIKKGDTVDACVDKERRMAIAKNHTATHLLQSALRKVLGEHVQQQGSFVGNEYLRFDFTHFKALSKEEIERTEELVNMYIREAHAVGVDEMNLEKAKKEGALAFFGDKYDQSVRMVSAGDFSKELCGGTHLKNTKDVELFKITSESSIASGIRRIEARTSEAAKEWIKEFSKREGEKEEAAQKKSEEKKSAKKRLDSIAGHVDGVIAKKEEVSGSSLIVAGLEDANPQMLRKASDIINGRLDDFVLFLASSSEGKISFLLSASESITKKGIHAGELMSSIAKLAGGSGGGKANIALGGAKYTVNIDNLLSDARKILIKELNK